MDIMKKIVVERFIVCGCGCFTYITLDGLLKFITINWFHQVVKCTETDGFNGILVMCGGENDIEVKFQGVKIEPTYEESLRDYSSIYNKKPDKTILEKDKNKIEKVEP